MIDQLKADDHYDNNTIYECDSCGCEFTDSDAINLFGLCDACEQERTENDNERRFVEDDYAAEDLARDNAQRFADFKAEFK